MKKLVILSAIFIAISSAPNALANIYFQETIPSVVRLEIFDSQDEFYTGTGFFISTDAYILTNAHVVIDDYTGEPVDYIDICTIEDEYTEPYCEFSGRVVAYDTYRDLAIVSPAFRLDEDYNEVGDYIDGVNDVDNSYVDFSDYLPQIGETVSILGFPQASLLKSITFTEGTISGFDYYEGVHYIATDATINPGNSGGPAYNSDERVIGVVNSITLDGIGGNYGYIISIEEVADWFYELAEEEVLNYDFVDYIFSNDEDYSDFNEEYDLTEDTYIFEDVLSSSKNAAAIYYLKENGIIDGYSDGTFEPLSEINRAELLKILVEGLGRHPSVETYSNCFEDVSVQWYASYVCFAKANGWVEGYEDSTFKPSQNVSKAEAIKMLLEVFDVPLEGDDSYEYFVDVEERDWFYKYINTAKYYNLLEEEGQYYRPKAYILRGQVSENIFRLLAS